MRKGPNLDFSSTNTQQHCIYYQCSERTRNPLGTRSHYDITIIKVVDVLFDTTTVWNNTTTNHSQQSSHIFVYWSIRTVTENRMLRPLVNYELTTKLLIMLNDVTIHSRIWSIMADKLATIENNIFERLHCTVNALAKFRSAIALAQAPQKIVMALFHSTSK